MNNPPPPAIRRAVAATRALLPGTGSNHANRDRRPVRTVLPSGAAIELPGPFTLATIWAPVLADGREWFQLGNALAVRDAGSDAEPEPVTPAAVVGELIRHLATLPPDETARAPYRDLVRFMAETGPTVRGDYVGKIVRAFRRRLPTWSTPTPEPRPKRRTLPPMTADERREYERARKAAQRARKTADAVPAQEDAAVWLLAYQQRTGPGVVVAAKDLHTKYVDKFAELNVRTVGRNTFHTVAEAAVGPRTRRRVDGKPQTAYITREVPQMTKEDRRDLARMIVAQIADEWRREANAGLAELLDGFRASQVDAPAERSGNVIPLRRAA